MHSIRISSDYLGYSRNVYLAGASVPAFICLKSVAKLAC